MIHTYYDERDINTEIDIELSDGRASQYKCVQAIQSFARRNVSSIQVNFENSHGKSKSDGLGGVVKGYASREVAATNSYTKRSLTVSVLQLETECIRLI